MLIAIAIFALICAAGVTLMAGWVAIAGFVRRRQIRHDGLGENGVARQLGYFHDHDRP